MAVPLPDRETLDAARKRAEEERAYWDAHRADLTSKYPDEFVAVQNGVVVGHDPDLIVLAQRLQAAGFAPNEATIEFMATEPELYLL